MTPGGEVATTAEQLPFLLLHRSHHPDGFMSCPRCGVDLTRTAIVYLAYVFDRCDCPSAEYVHLVEQLWHRACHAAEVGDAVATRMTEEEQLLAEARRDAKREALAGAIKAVLAEAGKGDRAAPSGQRITYPGGLRRAARIVDGLLGEVMNP